MTLLHDAEKFYEANAAKVDALVVEVQAAGADETALDEIVHEGAESAGIDSEEASAVNNHGLAFQISSILEGNGLEEGTRIIRAATGSSGPRP